VIDIIYVLPLFIFGTSIGSYLNVLGIRYSYEDGFRKSNEGRSHCPFCDSTLKWYELVPAISFIIQRGKCRTCHKKISIQYPIVEILAGFVFVLVPITLGVTFPALIWLLAFLAFIVLTIIDFRLRLIPNGITIFIALLGIALIAYYNVSNTFGFYNGRVSGSFLDSYALTFWFGNGDIFVNYAIGIAIGVIFFGGIYFL